MRTSRSSSGSTWISPPSTPSTACRTTPTRTMSSSRSVASWVRRRPVRPLSAVLAPHSPPLPSYSPPPPSHSPPLPSLRLPCRVLRAGDKNGKEVPAASPAAAPAEAAAEVPPRKVTLLDDEVDASLAELVAELDAPVHLGMQTRGAAPPIPQGGAAGTARNAPAQAGKRKRRVRGGLPPAWLVDVSNLNFHELQAEGKLSKLSVKEVRHGPVIAESRQSYGRVTVDSRQSSGRDPLQSRRSSPT